MGNSYWGNSVIYILIYIFPLKKDSYFIFQNQQSKHLPNWICLTFFKWDFQTETSYSVPPFSKVPLLVTFRGLCMFGLINNNSKWRKWLIWVWLIKSFKYLLTAKPKPNKYTQNVLFYFSILLSIWLSQYEQR